jgi:hypothetical protein
MKLNLGCGFNKPKGYIHVDMFEECQPDIIHNLESFPYPFEDNSIEEVLFNHSLEHIGQLPSVFLKVIQEVYRISKGGAIIKINVPHPRHDDFVSDPTHVRPITPLTLQLFDLELNLQWREMKAANSPLAIYLGVNLKLLSTKITLEPVYLQLLESEQINYDQIGKLIRERNNVAKEFQFILKVIKDIYS